MTTYGLCRACDVVVDITDFPDNDDVLCPPCDEARVAVLKLWFPTQHDWVRYHVPTSEIVSRRAATAAPDLQRLRDRVSRRE